MTSDPDLSKQLGEIKRRHLKDVADREGTPLNKWQADRAALLHIIEVQIPGMLRARASDLRKAAVLGSGSTIAKMRFAAEKIEAQATHIESLTKDNANG